MILGSYLKISITFLNFHNYPLFSTQQVKIILLTSFYLCVIISPLKNDWENNMKEKQTKKVRDSNYYKRKSLIAEKVALICFSTTLLSGCIALTIQAGYNDAITQLEDSKAQVCHDFKQSETFDTIFRQELANITNAYINREISFEDFEAKLNYIKSIEYAQFVAENTDNQLHQDLALINNEIISKNKALKQNIGYNAGLAGAIASVAGAFGGVMTNLVYRELSDREDKKKQKTL